MGFISKILRRLKLVKIRAKTEIEDITQNLEAATDSLVKEVADEVNQLTEQAKNELKDATIDAEKKLEEIGYFGQDLIDTVRGSDKKIKQWVKKINDGDIHQPPQSYIAQLPETKISVYDYALLCQDAYQYKDQTGDKIYQVTHDDRTYTLATYEDYKTIGLQHFFQHQTAKDSFQIAIYKYNNEQQQQQYIIVFIGSADPQDWAFNLFSTLAIEDLTPNEYMRETMKIGALMKGRDDVTFTGHSLGAALVYIAASMAQKEAIIFNGFMPTLTLNQKRKYLLSRPSYKAIYHYFVDSEALHLLRETKILKSPSVCKYVVLDTGRLEQADHQNFREVTLHKGSATDILLTLLGVIITTAILIPFLPLIALAVLAGRNFYPTLTMFALIVQRHDMGAVIACLAEKQTYETSSKMSANGRILFNALKRGNNKLKGLINKIIAH
ncbi:MAG: lipase family protein [Alphaproteobacteria bacterium]|nr:lipase family protein [Alphaproteobacteria bacterium]